jgi:cytochrome c oxidase cbb3-type subunit III
MLDTSRSLTLIRFNADYSGGSEKARTNNMSSKEHGYAMRAALVIELAFCWGLLFAGAFAAAQAQKGQEPKSKQETKSGRSIEAAVAEGRQVFESRCAGCHGLDGRGGERAPDIATSAKTQGRPDGELFRIIEKGVPDGGMPAFGSLGDRDIEAVISHVRLLQGKNQAARLPGDGQAGRGLFYGKARCSECHMVAGSGGFLGADLSAYGSRRSAEEIRQAITKPSTPNRQGGTMVVTTRDGRTFTGIVRNEDNFSIQLQTADGEFHLFVKSELQGFARTADSLMPTDYGSTLTAGELNDLVSFLMLAGGNGAHGDDPGQKPKRDDEEEQ